MSPRFINAVNKEFRGSPVRSLYYMLGILTLAGGCLYWIWANRDSVFVPLVVCAYTIFIVAANAKTLYRLIANKPCSPVAIATTTSNSVFLVVWPIVLALLVMQDNERSQFDLWTMREQSSLSLMSAVLSADTEEERARVGQVLESMIDAIEPQDTQTDSYIPQMLSAAIVVVGALIGVGGFFVVAYRLAPAVGASEPDIAKSV